ADLASTWLNAGRVDPQGRFVCGGMNEAEDLSPISSVYRLDGETATRLIEGVAITNSLAFSPDGERMYYTDMPTKRISVFTYGDELGAPRELIDLNAQAGLPDGSTVDADGCLWNAQWGGHRILRITPDGVLDRVVELPVSNPTCLAFGGPDLSTLFVTSARMGLSEEQLAQEPHAGDLLALDVGVKGLPERRFSSAA